jgi:hypothetical protein
VGEHEQTVAFLHSCADAAKSESNAPLKQAATQLCLALFNTNEFIYMP